MTSVGDELDGMVRMLKRLPARPVSVAASAVRRMSAASTDLNAETSLSPVYPFNASGETITLYDGPVAGPAGPEVPGVVRYDFTGPGSRHASRNAPTLRWQLPGGIHQLTGSSMS